MGGGEIYMEKILKERIKIMELIIENLEDHIKIQQEIMAILENELKIVKPF